MKILLIEDDREAASYLIQALDEAGHVAHHAADGETGHAMAAAMDYDVLIVDRMLPRRDGISIVETLRGEGDNTPVLILSALAQVDDRVKGLRAGGDDYLPKPLPSRSCSPASRCCRAAVPRRPRSRPAIASPISPSIAWPIASRAGRRRSSCSRASSDCSNIS